MAVRAVVFDVGGVLEKVDPPGVVTERWRSRLGLTAVEFQAAASQVDPDGSMETGGMTEAEFQRRYATALGLSEAQSAEFMRDMWNWYCGELDTDLAAYAASLRPRYATAILSNSADGARREEQARYGFEGLVDTIIYSHEVGLAKPDPRIFALTCDRLGLPPADIAFLDNIEPAVAAARAFGLHAVLHRSTPTSIAALNALLAS